MSSKKKRKRVPGTGIRIEIVPEGGRRIVCYIPYDLWGRIGFQARQRGQSLTRYLEELLEHDGSPIHTYGHGLAFAQEEAESRLNFFKTALEVLWIREEHGGKPTRAHRHYPARDEGDETLMARVRAREEYDRWEATLLRDVARYLAWWAKERARDLRAIQRESTRELKKEK